MLFGKCHPKQESVTVGKGALHRPYVLLPPQKAARTPLKNLLCWNIEREDEGLILSMGVRSLLIPLFDTPAG